MPAVPFVLTSTGRLVPLVDTRAEHVAIADIASSLAKSCRWHGATSVFFSVAQHCLICVDIAMELAPCQPAELLHVLLHDAHEAYIGDIPSPVKQLIGPAIGDVEKTLDRAIWQAFGLPEPTSALRELIVKADAIALATEHQLFMPRSAWKPSARPRPRMAIKPMPWPNAEARFLKTFNSLLFMAGLRAN